MHIETIRKNLFADRAFWWSWVSVSEGQFEAAFKFEMHVVGVH